MFPCRQYICVANVSWGFMPWECDLLVATASRKLYEIEIKVSYADLKADAKKEYKHAILKAGSKKISKFYYAITPAVEKKLREKPLDLPAHAGIILVEFAPRFKATVIKPAEDHKAERLSNAQYFKLMRLGCMRQWSGRMPVFDHGSVLSEAYEAAAIGGPEF
jgi:hypothetical protein